MFRPPATYWFAKTIERSVLRWNGSQVVSNSISGGWSKLSRHPIDVILRNFELYPLPHEFKLCDGSRKEYRGGTCAEEKLGEPKGHDCMPKLMLPSWNTVVGSVKFPDTPGNEIDSCV